MDKNFKNLVKKAFFGLYGKTGKKQERKSRSILLVFGCRVDSWGFFGGGSKKFHWEPALKKGGNDVLIKTWMVGGRGNFWEDEGGWLSRLVFYAFGRGFEFFY